jgi:hypothetical protein
MAGDIKNSDNKKFKKRGPSARLKEKKDFFIVIDDTSPKSTNELFEIVMPEKKAKGGRIGLKSGSKGCKLAKRGKGRAYGKNS